MTNPLLAPWTGAFSLPPFALIRDDQFAPAFEAALAEARTAIARIAADPAAPSFANTIEALEQSQPMLDRVGGVFHNLAGAESTPEREALQRDLAPKLAAFSSELLMNAALFARIEDLWARRAGLGLAADQLRVLELYRRMFVRAGAGLDEGARQRMAAINERLAVLSTRFSQNLLEDERSWVMPLADGDLDGLPEFVVTALAAAAEARGLPGHAVTLNRSHVVPFLQFSARRDLRQKAYEAWVARGETGGETDNRGIAAEMLALRDEQARLLGYGSFADYKLETEMARTPGAVRDLLMRVWAPARARANADGAILTGMMHADGINGDLEPWDWRYYSERRRLAEHDLDEAELKPYFGLEAMIEAAFDCANRLFGLAFRPLEAPLYHPDVRAWEVTRDGAHIAVFLGDYFARPSKRSGAWCSTFREQKKLGGAQRPIVVNVCNFAKPPKGEPALLSWDDARTLFHEFGHALHQMLSDQTYGFISGTSVPSDFVELPSQLYEHWLELPEVLDRHARHARTGAPMPPELRDRLLAAATYDQGFATVEFVASALVDLAFHEGRPPADPMAMQRSVLEEIGMPHAIRMRHATPHFAHVFSGGFYAAGYYSYMWSEVMDADAFEAFRETGDPFDAATAQRLEEHVLSAGASREADKLYLAFRGRMPGVEALLRGRGLLDVT